MPIDPRTITGADWPGIHTVVFFLWLVVFLNVGFAFSMLFGHAIIPSLIATGHLEGMFHRFRPILYVVGLLALMISGLVIYNWVSSLPIIYDLYDKRLI